MAIASLSTSFAALSCTGVKGSAISSVASSFAAPGSTGLKLTLTSALGRRTRPSVFVLAVRATTAVGASFASPAEVENEDIEAWVKRVLPGGIAAQRLLGTGRRKCAVARVVLIDGTGKIIINNRYAQEYLQGNPVWLQAVKFPLASLGYESKYDTIVRAEGGGLSAQAQAILLGVARALLVANPGNRAPLKKQGLLTRDSRVVERKKYGLKKARKAPQYSKR